MRFLKQIELMGTWRPAPRGKPAQKIVRKQLLRRFRVWCVHILQVGRHDPEVEWGKKTAGFPACPPTKCVNLAQCDRPATDASHQSR